MSRNWRARNQVMVAKMERERQLLDERQQNRSDLLKGAILAGMIVDEEVTQRKQKKTLDNYAKTVGLEWNKAVKGYVYSDTHPEGIDKVGATEIEDRQVFLTEADLGAVMLNDNFGVYDDDEAAKVIQSKGFKTKYTSLSEENKYEITGKYYDQLEKDILTWNNPVATSDDETAELSSENIQHDAATTTDTTTETAETEADTTFARTDDDWRKDIFSPVMYLGEANKFKFSDDIYMEFIDSTGIEESIEDMSSRKLNREFVKWKRKTDREARKAAKEKLKAPKDVMDIYEFMKELQDQAGGE